MAFVPSAALGHAEFVGRTSVPAGSDQKLTLNVPEEKGPDVHSTRVVFVVPAGFTVSGCDQKPDWACEVASGSNGRTLVRYTRSSGTNPTGTSASGSARPTGPETIPFPTNQSYSDNTTMRWSGRPGSDHPAPVLKVT